MFFATLSNILGAVILIAIVLPWFLIAVCTISVAYLWAAMFYRASARELKASILLIESDTIILMPIAHTAPGCDSPILALQPLLGVLVRACHHPCLRRI